MESWPPYLLTIPKCPCYNYILQSVGKYVTTSPQGWRGFRLIFGPWGFLGCKHPNNSHVQLTNTTTLNVELGRYTDSSFQPHQREPVSLRNWYYTIFSFELTTTWSCLVYQFALFVSCDLRSRRPGAMFAYSCISCDYIVTNSEQALSQP